MRLRNLAIARIASASSVDITAADSSDVNRPA